MTRTQGWAAVAGVVAVAVTAVAGQLLAALFSPEASPISAVGTITIDVMPQPLKEWAIDTFGTADKLALVVAMVLVIGVLAVVAGAGEYRRRYTGVALIVVFSALGAAAAVSRPAAGAAAAIAPLLAGAAGALLLAGLVNQLRLSVQEAQAAQEAQEAQKSSVAPAAHEAPHAPAAPQAPAARQPLSAGAGMQRRKFLGATAVSAAAGVVGGLVSGSLRQAQSAATALRSAVQLPRPASGSKPIPDAATLKLDGISALVTDTDTFYRIDTAFTVPRIDPTTWRLKVTGMVEQEVEIDFGQLRARPLIERYITLACVSNPIGGELIGNAKWLGWPIRDLLAQASPAADADMVLSTSADGWTAGTPLEVLTDNRDAMLAIGMNDAPLPFEHGFPVRMVVPGLYGYVSATKWVTELKVTRFADDVAYWTTRGWAARGPIKTSSRIDTPRNGANRPPGRLRLGGMAWSQHVGIRAVEVKVDDGEWQPAELAAAISTDTWRQWVADVDLEPGERELTVRAIDRNGDVQIGEFAPPIPSGATGYHSITVQIG
ncbi:molybdopterin-dependent oxidoreductase [Arthrobacter castelli]|uniref:molybdopterin-dependent oxidoreductase n=1 Tax=Arthrobacter castelli TaxID=271431 RepID=UPI00047C1745|nr:molybdopterin-dependent oxidoreductase [Arthrobacter castelli]